MTRHGRRNLRFQAFSASGNAHILDGFDPVSEREGCEACLFSYGKVTGSG